jgi:putative peptide zinc metalloprotease protein
MALLESSAGPLDPPQHGAPATPVPAPGLAAGVELLGASRGSGYRRPPALARRADGQVVQLTPTVFALLELVDGQRDAPALAAALSERIGKAVDPEQVRTLLDRVGPLGLLDGPAGAAGAARSNPLLALRCRYVITDADRTDRITRPFTALFHPVAVLGFVAAFLAISAWLVLDHGLAQAARHVLYEPALLLTVFGLTVVSAAFHELGHAAACRYGGATPGVMGAGLYLVFPAFYTDVSDSYRLERKGRLRVDVGGLYFNAVFAVGAFLAWRITGSEALLVVIPLQQLQMLKQLPPFIRLDGYHILADLTGVPDLFARVKPTLASLLPSHWGRPENRVLKPWARAIVTIWVVLVVPLLVVMVLAMIVTLPRLVATIWDSAGQQLDDLASRWRDGDAVRTVLGGISLVALVLPLFSVTYFLSRLVRRTGRRVWAGTDGNPPLRFAALAGAAAILLVAAASWWPSADRYRPISADERGTAVELLHSAISLDGAAPVAATAPVAAAAATEDEAPVPSDPPLIVVEIDPDTLALPLPELAEFDFGLPQAPREDDNQSLALNRTDGTVVNVGSSELVWVLDGVVDQVNEAWALTNCRDCATQAVAFQVILVVGQADVVSPQNLAVAVNGNCASCVANAIAQQLVLTLEAVPSDAELAALAAVWERVEEAMASLGTVPIDETMAALESLGAEIVAVLAPSLAEVGAGPTTTIPSDPDEPATTTSTSSPPDGESSTTTTVEPPSTTEPPPTTDPPSPTTSEPSTSDG